MTIFGTPGGSVANMQPFQGTTPGNITAGATLQLTNPAVGLFPPHADMRSGDTVMAAASRAAAPANVKLTNAIIGKTPAGRSLTEALADGGRVGTAHNPTTVRDERGFLSVGSGFDTMNFSANGGGGGGAGGKNQEIGRAAGQASQLATPTPSSVITTDSPANYQG